VVDVLERWTSPESGAVYPVRWRIASATAAIDLDVDRLLDAQELRTSFTYWEGAVSVRGTRTGRATAGHGYVEMTGYAGSMRGVFQGTAGGPAPKEGRRWRRTILS
jgi:predicted secreted hydrolase